MSQGNPVHPLDPLSIDEIATASGILRQHAAGQSLKFNCVTLREPARAEYTAWKADQGPRPDRRAYSIVLKGGSAAVATAVVNISKRKVDEWNDVDDVAPTLTLDDLDHLEINARKDPRVIEACREVGVTDMSKIYVDAWAIGFDDRWGFERRLQQGLVYYRNSPSDNQYAHPLDFSLVADTETAEILSVDIRRVNGQRTKVPLGEHNYLPEYIGAKYAVDVLKPIDITQPGGVSFQMRGNVLSWAGYEMHIGFNYREGIVISDVSMYDHYQKRQRTLFNRLSIAEMVVPYGNPDPPHHKKHAFDVGEYGSGLMSNSLELGCDCKGAIHYMDGIVATAKGEATVIKNAICIHEEDNGILYKHTDFRDGSVISARDRRLVISQIITAANYDYAFYHIFTLDGTYKMEMKLTGMLNTYGLHPTEQAAPYGVEVAPGITAHNHQHIFSLRVDPAIDGPKNSVVQNDAVASKEPVGSPENYFGNGFYCQKTPLRTPSEAAADYNHQTSRSWDIINPNVLNPNTKKPIGYKILNNNCPKLLASPDSIVSQRAAFASKALWVVPYRDHELFPAGEFVCQSTGKTHQHNPTIVDWVSRGGSINNADIVCYLQFGLTHFPRTEDFPIMPAEPVGITLRASSFFEKNPALWVPVSSVNKDHTSRNAFSTSASSCCADDHKAVGLKAHL
ncbi:copper amine oxidase [Pestalotiopsis sp. NC0098]|nr:copper amine oxidase [Pestalotiopsis sp. NC0098]